MKLPKLKRNWINLKGPPYCPSKRKSNDINNSNNNYNDDDEDNDDDDDDDDNDDENLARPESEKWKWSLSTLGCQASCEPSNGNSDLITLDLPCREPK